MTTIRVYLKEGGEKRASDLSVYVEECGAGPFFKLESGYPIPEGIGEFIKSFSMRDTIPVTPNRDRGIYVLNSASGEIELNGNFYFIDIESPDLEDAKDLLAAIKAGTIKPEVSYEGAQAGPNSPEELGNSMRKQMKFFFSREFSGRWPFCRKSAVVKFIDQLCIAGEGDQKS